MTAGNTDVIFKFVFYSGFYSQITVVTKLASSLISTAMPQSLLWVGSLARLAWVSTEVALFYIDSSFDSREYIPESLQQPDTASQSWTAASQAGLQPTARNRVVGTCCCCAGRAVHISFPRHGGLHPLQDTSQMRLPGWQGKKALVGGLKLMNQGCIPTLGLWTWLHSCALET